MSTSSQAIPKQKKTGKPFKHCHAYNAMGEPCGAAERLCVPDLDGKLRCYLHSHRKLTLVKEMAEGRRRSRERQKLQINIQDALQRLAQPSSDLQAYWRT